ncbi:hypothetical protein ABW21_db0209362 [Orbilia brochopaga]|nr:hypothetical protein ABW21_db0209362 [Drechslerella brochopaga]
MSGEFEPVARETEPRPSRLSIFPIKYTTSRLDPLEYPLSPSATSPPPPPAVIKRPRPPRKARTRTSPRKPPTSRRSSSSSTMHAPLQPYPPPSPVAIQATSPPVNTQVPVHGPSRCGCPTCCPQTADPVPVPASPPSLPQSPAELEGSFPGAAVWAPTTYALTEFPQAVIPVQDPTALIPIPDPASYVPYQYLPQFYVPYEAVYGSYSWPQAAWEPAQQQLPVPQQILPSSAYPAADEFVYNPFYSPPDVIPQQVYFPHNGEQAVSQYPQGLEGQIVPLELHHPTDPNTPPFSIEQVAGLELVTDLLGPYTDIPEWRREAPANDYTVYSAHQIEIPALQQPDFFSEFIDLNATIDMDETEASSSGVEMKTAQELADLEKLSQAYEAEVEGPLIGELKSSSALQDEYDGADEAFVKKTAALVPKYSNYRPVKGDGNCGWRALAFGYFELLLRTGDKEFIKKEQARVKAMNKLMDGVGMSEYLYEDFVEETMQLFSALQQSPVIDNPYDDQLLLATFNDEAMSNGIITHLRLLTAGQLKLNPANYEPFIEMTIQEYCASAVEPFNVQIDHIGVKALIDILFLPAGFVVEISYLDRSVGDEVNVHRFEDESGNPPAAIPANRGEEPPTLRLLYRPGHYDLIYKNEDLAPAALPTSSSKGKQPIQVSMMLGQSFDRPKKSKAPESKNKRQRTRATDDSTPVSWFCTPPAPSPDEASPKTKRWWDLTAEPTVTGWNTSGNIFEYNDGKTTKTSAPRYTEPITLSQLENPCFVVHTSDDPLCAQPLAVDQPDQNLALTPFILMEHPSAKGGGGGRRRSADSSCREE